MRKFDLLEKLEVYQIDLLMYMSSVGGTATKKELLDHLEISDYFLSKLIEGLMTSAKRSNDCFSIHTNKTAISIQTEPDFSLHSLYNEWVISAPKYKILEELLLFGAIDVARLCEKIGISHSTYFRKLNELNGLLDEFDLSIQNGVLVGSELQIRFFYVTFYLVTNSKHQLHFPTIDPRVYETVNSLQQVLGSKVSGLARKKLIFYLSLVKRRHAQKNISDYKEREPFFSNLSDIRTQKKFIRLLKSTDLFKKTNQALGVFLVYYSFKMSPNETVLLLLFMLGEEIIPATSQCLNELDTIEKNSGLLIHTLNTEFLKFMKKRYPTSDLNEQQRSVLHYYLNATSYQQLIFKGTIEYYGKTESSIWRENVHLNTIAQFVCHLKTSDSKIFTDHFNHNALMTKYAHAISFYEECTPTKISVGIFIEGDLLYKQKFTNWWTKYVELVPFAQAEPLADDQFYDLVISNVEYSTLKKRGKYFFFLNNYCEKQDIADLDQFLTTIYFTPT